MKIAFFGTWEFSKNILNSILSISEIEVSLVVSQPDKPSGRKKIITPTTIKVLAQEKNIAVLQPENLRNNNDFFEELIKRDLDFIVVVAYGKIVPIEVLDAPKYWCINIHGSILPAYRWASPIQESIKNGDTKTWLTIMYMSEGMDEWDILQIQEVWIDMIDTTENIFQKFEKIWPHLLVKTLNWILKWDIKWIKQNQSWASYCSKIEKKDWEIDFNLSAQSIYNKHKAYSTWPWIYSFYHDKKITIEECLFEKSSEITQKYSIWEVIKIDKKVIWVVCKDSFLILKQIKLEWKKSMDINSFINGNKEFLDYKFKTCGI